MTGKKQGLFCILASVFLLFCAVLPLFFRNGDELSPSPPGVSPQIATFPLTELDDKTNLYLKYNSGQSGMSVTKTPLSFEDESDYNDHVQPSTDLLESLFSQFGIDEEEYSVGEQGFNYFSLTDSSGATIRIAEHYKRWYGDWENWLRIAVDIDTLDIYYVYISCNCLEHFEKYIGDPIYILDIAEDFGEITGMEVLDISETYSVTSGKNRFTALYGLKEEKRTYLISGSTYYDENTLSYLIDYTLLLQPSDLPAEAYSSSVELNSEQDSPAAYDE